MTYEKFIASFKKDTTQINEDTFILIMVSQYGKDMSYAKHIYDLFTKPMLRE